VSQKSVSQNKFGAKTTTDEVIEGIDLNGKTVVITGTSAGLGSETARIMAKAGATVVMAARDAQKNGNAISAIRAALPHAKLQHVTLDLSDLASVRRAAGEILAAHPRIDMLINNAGIMACPLMHTTDGFEMQFGTNHLGHFLLTCLLVPALKTAPAARIVSLSSGGHRIGPVDFDDPNFERRPYHNWLAYGQAKTANALFAVGLTQRLQKFGITANAVHPGSIATELGRHLTEADVEMMKSWSSQGMHIEYKTPAQGAATQVWAAVSPELANISGHYLEDCHIGVADDAPTDMTGYASYALDAAAAEQLWTLSEKSVGQQFSFN
jgi:NAD(P)-dependent dehydrogenase (short-subunit alcohol dehydrogenase family)